MDNLSIEMARGLLKLAETLVKTRDEMRQTIDKLEHQRKVVDTCANTLIDTLKDALLIACNNAGSSSSDELERPMVDDLCQKEGERFGKPSDDEDGDSVQDGAGNPDEGYAPDAG